MSSDGRRIRGLPLLLLLPLMSVAGECPPVQSEQETPHLQPGVAISRELSGGEAHRFRIASRKDAFFRVVVSRTEMKFEIAILGPDGRRLREGRNREFGEAALSLIAAEPEAHFFEVRNTGSSPKREAYSVRLDAHREARPEDPKRIIAEGMVMRAGTLYQKNLSREAIELFENSAALWRELEDGGEEAAALLEAGQVSYLISEQKRAKANLERALSLWQSLNDGHGIASTRIPLASVYFETGNIPEAIKQYTWSLEYWVAANALRGQAQCYTPLGVIHGQLGQLQQAIEYHQRALDIYRQLGDRERESIPLNSMGELFLWIGETQNAIDAGRQSLKISEERGNQIRQKLSHGIIGEGLMSQGNVSEALDHFRKELALAREIGDERLKAFALKRLGSAHGQAGERKQALEHYEEALALFRKTESPQEEADVLNSIGSEKESSGDGKEALSFYESALTMSRGVQDIFGEIRALQNIARMRRAVGELGQARARIEEAIRLIESVRARVISPQFRSTFFSTVQQSYALHVDLLMQSHRREPGKGLDGLALRMHERSRARVLMELVAEARAGIRGEMPAELRAREEELRQSLNLRANQQMRLLARAHTAAEAEEAAREIRAIEVEYEKLQARIRAASPALAALEYPQPLSEAEIRARVLDDDSVLLIYSLGEERSHLWVLTRQSLQSYELPARAAIEKKTQEVYGLMTMRQSDAQNDTTFLARVRQADEAYWREAAALGRMILGPARAQLDKKRWIIVADGGLQRFPFGALPEPESSAQSERASGPQPAEPAEPVLLHHETVYSPSASLLALLREGNARRPPPTKLLAVLADPVFQPDDSRLAKSARPAPARATGEPRPPSRRMLRDFNADKPLELRRLTMSEDEARTIASMAASKPHMLALGVDATRALASGSQLEPYRYIHFATHGLLNDQHPHLSGLVLSLYNQQGEPVEGFLRMHEIYGLKLSADLVVLSACDTGLGKEVKGEGLMALTRGFMYAGAARVVASLWRVDDTATSLLMREFYRQLLQQDLAPAAALTEAQRAMWRNKRWRAPYYWAAFVLQGEYH